MRKMANLVPIALLALVVTSAVFTPIGELYAGEEGDLDKMIASAKTAADHEAIAAEYEKRATAATADSGQHDEMEAAYKKAGGALIAKQHIDAHCAALGKLYKKIAKENALLAKAHKAMAQEAK